MSHSFDKTTEESSDYIVGRGDSRAKGFKLTDESGTAVDITGFTFILTVNTHRNPDPAVPIGTELFSVAGVIIDANEGTFSFAPTAVDTDQLPADYFYDIQMTDAGGGIQTIIKGKFVVIQDVSK